MCIHQYADHLLSVQLTAGCKDLSADGGCCCFVVACNHYEADASCLAQVDGPSYLLPGWVMHSHHTYQCQICLILLADLHTKMHSFHTAAQGCLVIWMYWSFRCCRQPLLIACCPRLPHEGTFNSRHCTDFTVSRSPMAQYKPWNCQQNGFCKQGQDSAGPSCCQRR